MGVVKFWKVVPVFTHGKRVEIQLLIFKVYMKQWVRLLHQWSSRKEGYWMKKKGGGGGGYCRLGPV